MKTAIAIFFAFTLAVIGCKKDSLSTPGGSSTIDTTTYLGKWRIIVDSSFSHYEFSPDTTVSAYTGDSTDYLDFASNDSLYLKEGTIHNLGKYSFFSESPQANAKSFTTDVFVGGFTWTAHNMTFYYTFRTWTPEFSGYDVIYLER